MAAIAAIALRKVASTTLTLYSKHGCARRRSLAGLHGYSLKLVHTSCGRIELSSHFRSWHHGPDSMHSEVSACGRREKAIRE